MSEPDSSDLLALVPAPLHIRTLPSTGAGIGPRITIGHDETEGFAAVGRWFQREIEGATGWEASLVLLGAGHAPTIELRKGPVACAAEAPPASREEAYELSVAEGRITVTAPAAPGAFYGLQTLRQLLPDAAYRRAPVGPAPLGPVTLAAVEIADAPRLSWRGVHIDVCRHFMPKAFVLKLIDLAAMHKCNVLHLHLTEDQGWRIPIEAYPRLTEVGAFRRESPVGHYEEGRFDDTPHGGFYSRDDLREIVAYARERQMTVLPEIDMPGHMVAAIASYPELGNTPDPVEVLTTWGICDHVLNLEESTIEFCKTVIDEVVELFPGGHFHVGGDECPTTEWKKSPRAQELMAANGFTEERQLQGWFTARMAEHLRERGRTLVGWDEILEGGAPEGAVVMSWRGEEGGVAAASAGHDVVMTPEQWLYFDWAYSDDPAEPVAIRPATTVERVYSYDPVSKAIPPEQRHHVLGAQCQLWTEYVPTPEHAEYMYFPRLSAFSEAVWSPASEKSYAGFEKRLERHLGRLDAIGVNYRPLGGPHPGQARIWQDPASRSS